MRGDKVEFRKQPFARPVEHLVIYATAPVQHVIGSFRVAACDVAEPAELWKRYGHVGGIEQRDFDGYYEGRQSGVAISVDGPPTPLDLPQTAVGQVRPPKSFTYLSAETAQRIGLEASDHEAPDVSRDQPATVERSGTVEAIRKRLASVAPNIRAVLCIECAAAMAAKWPPRILGEVRTRWDVNGRHECVFAGRASRTRRRIPCSSLSALLKGVLPPTHHRSSTVDPGLGARIGVVGAA
jgi:predicted transcriptional regulator